MNSLSLFINHGSGYIEERYTNKWIVFDSTDENKELLKKYNNVFDGISGKSKDVCIDKCDYEKDYMKIKFNSDDNLPLNKPLKFQVMTLTIRSVFKEDGTLYPQVFLNDTLYELNLYQTYILIFQKVLMLIKQMYQTNVIFPTIGTSYILVKYDPYLCNKLWALIILLLHMLKKVLTEFIFGMWPKMMQLI